MKNYLIEGELKWIELYPKIHKCCFSYSKWGYFDERPHVHTTITTLLMFILISLSFFTSYWLLLSLMFIFVGWGELFIYLPFKSGICDSKDSPDYGFYFYCVDSPEWHLFEMLVIQTGKGLPTYIYAPWNFEHYRRSIKLNDNTWESEIKGEKSKDFWKDEWNDKKLTYHYDYTDSYDQSIIPTKITVSQSEWRRRALMQIPLFNKVKTYIEIEFSKEVGKQKGEWKGGCIGCSYELLPNETPLDCIKRMEKERIREENK